ncbi:hypothetical protein BS47DRAFT_1399860 [Hydnum rufescens UP504]|uniref:Uncharacterized protein n=1 Tax=Hydnum rufescens UP504 TaxID=1448309 RepID=A0A9P6AIN0_9AGAM|nr:hypothetical protein BS47DRAFT_1399860 [Hydnum rufescens UP504]
MSDNEGPHMDPDQPAVDHYGNFKDTSLLELDVSPDTLAAKAHLAADAFPQNLGNKPNHGMLSYNSGDEDSDAELHTSPTGVHTAFAAFSINPNNLKTLGAGEAIIPCRNCNAKEKVSGSHPVQRTQVKHVEISQALQYGKRKATGPSKSSSDTKTLSDKSHGGQQATKKQHINDSNSDADNGSHTQDDEAAEFSAADKASTALILANHPKRTDATRDLDGVFGKPEVHKNLNKQVDELMQACLVFNLAQGAFIKGLSTAISNASFNADVGNPEEDEDDIINLIDGMDEVDAVNPFPTGSLLFKIRAFIIKFPIMRSAALLWPRTFSTSVAMMSGSRNLN